VESSPPRAAARLLAALSRICPCPALNKSRIHGAWHPSYARPRHKLSPSKITLREVSPFLPRLGCHHDYFNPASGISIRGKPHLHPRALGICQLLPFAILHCYKPLDFLLSTGVCTNVATSAVRIGCRDQGKLPEKIRPWISIKTHLFLAESYSHHLYSWAG